jgi:CRP-like cAMP-binding protein
MRQEATVRRLNRILQRLPDADYDRIAPRFENVALSFKETLYEQQQRIEQMYFVESGVISLVTDLEDGGTIETGTIGNEGVVGVPAFLGMPIATCRAFCQIPGSALRVDMDPMLRERERNSPLAQLILRVANATMSMLAQTAACNRAHPVEERMARWLLMTHDRVGGDEFPLTQQFLAQMLGVRRPSVNTAGLALQQAGLIRYSRGKISIVNRPGLEASSCECYAYIARQFAIALDGASSVPQFSPAANGSWQ